MPGQIVHFEIPADDTAKGREFWGSLFGWQFDSVPGPFEYHMTRISDQAWQSSFMTAVGASAYATWACVDSWLTDFRADLREIDVPTLLLHGNADRILPYEATAARVPGLIKELEFVTIDGGPHNIGWTHADEVNAALLGFLRR